MSLPPPRVWRLVPPPPCAPSTSFDPTVETAVRSLAARTDLASSQTVKKRAQQQQHVPPQRHVTLHPVLPWVAYTVAEGVAATDQANSLSIVVQDLNTQSVLWNLNVMDLAACLYGERNPAKLPAATKSLGTVLSLNFFDSSSLYWSGMATVKNQSSAAAGSAAQQQEATAQRNANFSWLVVQTTSRLLVLQLRESQYSAAVVLTPAISGSASANSRYTRQAWLVSHLHEKALGGTAPSSNLLPIDQDTWLVGCHDGSLKVWDRTSHQPVKSIKGLGKGDWIVEILPANRYSTTTTTSVDASGGTSSSGLIQTKRILAVTKRQSVYLIELEFLVGVAPAGGENTNARDGSLASVLEIRPPLARFVADGSAEKESSKDGSVVVSYDAHRDWILWMVPARKGSPNTTVLVWNLHVLQPDFLKQADSSNKAGTIFKPDPTLTIQFPGSSDSSSQLTVLPTLQHAAFSEDAVVCGVTTEGGGDFYLQAAVGKSPVNATAIATPVMGVSLSQLLQRDLSLEVGEDETPPVIHIYAARAQPLGERPVVLLATNVGFVVVDVEASKLSGPRRVHFGAGLGSLGKSVLSIHHSDVVYGSLDVLTANPVGLMEAKNPTVVYESPPPVHLPAEFQNRPFRLTPIFSVSPSGLYVSLFWPFEFRYEILHVPSTLQKVGQRASAGSSSGRNPLVASGTGVIGFAWLGDEDDYALISAEDLMERAIFLMATAPVMVVPTAEGGLTMANLNPANLNLSDLMDVQKTAMGVANLTTGVAKIAVGGTLSATKAATDMTLGATKAAGKATLNVTKAATDKALATTEKIGSSVTKGVKKSLRVFGLKKKKEKGGGALTEETEEMDEADPETLARMQQEMAAQILANSEGIDTAAAGLEQSKKKRPFVELRSLVAVESQSAELSASIAAATSSGLGKLTLRGGNRNPPTILFGGPVLIVASRSEEDPKGHAHFYTRKVDEQDNRATAYVSTGPTLPFPDLVAWDDDGRLCAVVVENRVAIYLSELPNFTLLGAVRVGGSSKIVHVKFVHGVLYCCSWNSVHCIFLGDLKGNLCMLDSYMLASAVVPTIPSRPMNGDEYTSFMPPVVPLPLVHPFILGYQSGSLVVSTVRGVHSIPMNHPLLRIGSLLGAGQVKRASKWFDAVPNRDHESLANFLQRRGHPNLALQLPGLSLETIIDISMREGYVGRLEEVVEEYGVKGLRAIDMGRGVSSGILGPERDAHSIVVCVGAYLLAHGKVELTRRIATELLRYGEDGRKDALFLATLLLSADEADASRLITRAVEENGHGSEWLVGSFVRDHVLSRKA